MYKIGLLEDEQEQAERLLGFLDRYREAHPDFACTVQRYDRAMDLLDHYDRDCDLLFLDIRLPDMTGMEAAHRIREVDRRVMIIFVTSLTQYAIEGYSVQAFDYIVKPVSYEPFAAKLERAVRVLGYRQTGVVLDIKTREGGLRLTSDMIHYLEVFDHDLLIHTDDGVIKQWGSLSKYYTSYPIPLSRSLICASSSWDCRNISDSSFVSRVIFSSKGSPSSCCSSMPTYRPGVRI